MGNILKKAVKQARIPRNRRDDYIKATKTVFGEDVRHTMMQAAMRSLMDVCKKSGVDFDTLDEETTHAMVKMFLLGANYGVDSAGKLVNALEKQST